MIQVRTIALVLSALTAGMLWVTPAGADDGDHAHEGEGSTTLAANPDGIKLDEGIFVTGAVVTPLAGGKPRVMVEYDAAVFVQSWMGSAYFCMECEQKDPPPELPVSRIDAAGSWAGELGNVTAYYATDGTTAYIAFAGLEAWTDPSAIPPPSSWFVPPVRVIDAFNGDAELIETQGTQLATSGPLPPDEGRDEGRDEAAAESNASRSSGPWPWVGAGAIAAAVVGGGLLLRRRRA